MEIPPLDLSFGQLAWALNRGAPPPQTLIDQLTYLRQLGIPFSGKERRRGRGHRLHYRYEHLIECGVALYALRQHVKPADVKKVLVHHRAAMREQYRAALAEVPLAALGAPWVKSRGAERPLMPPGRWIRVHDRFADKPGTFELVGPGELEALKEFGLFSMIERYPGERVRGLVPLTELALEWTAWALVAPETKPGPKA